MAAQLSPFVEVNGKQHMGISGNISKSRALSIADHGGWEEFHQKRGNYFMYDYHKNERLKMEREYRAIQVHQEG